MFIVKMGFTTKYHEQKHRLEETSVPPHLCLCVRGSDHGVVSASRSKQHRQCCLNIQS